MKNFKQACLGAATMAVMATGVAITTDSAQAAILSGSTLSVTGNAKLTDADVAIGGLSTLDFLQGGPSPTSVLFQENTSTGSFGPSGADSTVSSGNFGFYVDTKDLTLKKTAVSHWELQGPVTDFIRRGTGTSGFAYNLQSFILEQVTILGQTIFVTATTGSFIDFSDNATIDAGGPFTAQTSKFVLSGTTISGDITANAIPTPALLPGLLGMGIAAWRKRKSEEVLEA